MTRSWPVAPFHVGGAVFDDRRFVDRVQLLDSLCAQVADRAAVGFVLMAPRRSGKSSVLKRLKARIDSEARVVYLDLLGLLGHGDSWPSGTVAQAVLSELVQAIEAEVGCGDGQVRLGGAPFDPNDFRRRSLPKLLELGDPSRRMVVLLDELEVALARDPRAPAELVAALGAPPGFRGPAPFLGFALGRAFGRGLPRDIPSPLKDFSREDLTWFRDGEVRSALEQPLQGTYAWSAEALVAAWDLTAGHPLFVAALGAAVHGHRRPEHRSDVRKEEVLAALDAAVDRAAPWGDAWRQLSRRHQILLRALAERSPRNLADVEVLVRAWGATLGRDDFEPLVRGLVDDEVLVRRPEGLAFPVELARRWVLAIDPEEILGAPEDPRDGIAADAARAEIVGRRAYVDGRLDDAAKEFAAALELDPARWIAAVGLGQVLLQKGEPEEAARMLRGAAMNADVRRVRAQALAAALSRALDRHEDAAPWADELRAIDPNLEDAPDARLVLARIAIEAWWRDVIEADADRAVQITSELVLEPSGERPLAALRRAGAEVNAALEGRSTFEPLAIVVAHVLPLLLRAVEQQLPASQEEGAWLANLRTAVAGVARLTPDPGSLGPQVPPSSILGLLDAQGIGGARAAVAQVRSEILALVMRVCTPDRIAELACEHAGWARGAAALTARLDPSASRMRLVAGYMRACELAESGPATGLVHALQALPAIGLGALGALDPGTSAGEINDLVVSTQYLVHRLGDDPEAQSLFMTAFSDGDRVEWSRLLDLFAADCPAEVAAIRRVLEPTHSASEGADTSAARERLPATSAIQSILGGAYVVERPVSYRIHGVPPGYVRAWSVDRKGRRLLARAYAVEGGEPAIQSFLAHLWENERRLLSTLATRWEGRALPRLWFSRFVAESGLLVIVTDYVGPVTLRDLLVSGEISRMRRVSRSALWTHLHGLVDALAALHRAGYLHRAIRPEHVLVDPDARSNLGRPWLRVANFEWSVYLYGLAGMRAQEARYFDRYMAPERLGLRGVDDPAMGAGEGPATDAFALGLLLFECLVNPLHPEELERIPSRYNQGDHNQWIEKLLVQVDEAFDNGRLFSAEVLLLKNMLRPDPGRRWGDLDSVLDVVGQLARQDVSADSAESVEPLQLVTTLAIGTPESIARFIGEDLPNLEFATVDELATWLEAELKDATIRPNRGAAAPLLLFGRSLNFTVAPFAHDGKRHRQIGWLKVASEQDRPVGAEIGRLSRGVRVHNYRRDMPLAPLLASADTWAPWFAAIERLHEGLSTDERAFVDRVRWSIELERRSWFRQVLRYELVSYVAGGRPGEPDLAVIRDTSEPQQKRAYTLGDLMAQSIDRGNTWFELGPTRDPTARFQLGRRWTHGGDGDAKSGHVTLKRFRREGAGPPENTGWIRPYSLAGHRTLYERRKDVLADLERDPYLVRALLTPREVFDDLNLPPSRVFDARLDADKQALALAIQNRQPMFVVQGPPGTGKTTLAAEVILRTMHENPSARILVVAQAHDPLNNLLERVQQAVDDLKRGGVAMSPTCVRLTSEERLDERRYGKEGTRVARAWHPSKVAAAIVEQASRWQPGPEDLQHPGALKAWRALIGTQALHGVSRSLERRLVSSANLVYATANDRRLAGLRPGSFDLVIYEETAKAFPIEVIGPLRLARRWLLIGDQRQLPPFGLADVDAALADDIARFRQERGAGRHVGADAQGVDPGSILGEVAPPLDLWAELTAEMTNLLRFFAFVHARASTVPLGASLPGGLDGQSAALRGLTGMLQTQWRMHPVIGDFVSHCFYEGMVRNGDRDNLTRWRRHGLESPAEIRDQAIVWLDVPFVMDEPLATERRGFGGGWENGFEARALLGFARAALSRARRAQTLAVLSPYRAQIGALSRIAGDYQIPMIGDLLNCLHTADSFQGKQADMVLVSLVRNNAKAPPTWESRVRAGLGFLETPERSTVIFSRAERLLVVVGCLRHFRRFEGTVMARVAARVDKLSADPKSGVVVLRAEDFIEHRHWEAMLRYHDDWEARERKAQERDAARLSVTEEEQ